MSTDWRRLSEEIVGRLDIIAEYKKLGVEFEKPDPQPNGSGFVGCYPRSDQSRKKASACVHVASGVYKDMRAGSAESMGFFDFAVRYGNGQFLKWWDAFCHFAKEVKLGKRLPKDRIDRPVDHLKFYDHPYLEILWRGLVESRPGITLDSIVLCGGRPAMLNGRWSVVALPIYGQQLLDESPVGWVCLDSGGRMLQLHPEMPLAKTITVTGSDCGFLGQHGVSRLLEPDVEIVWKVEGITDMLALQAAIPDEMRSSHLVITNPHGAGESKTPKAMVQTLSGRHMAIVHDVGDPNNAGQDGVKVWLGEVGSAVESIRNVVLPCADGERVDLRSWLVAGHTFHELLEIYHGTKPFDRVKDADQAITTSEDILLKSDIHVLGQLKGTKHVAVYSSFTGKIEIIERMERFGFQDLVLLGGAKICDTVCLAHDSKTKKPFTLFKTCVSEVAATRVLSDSEFLGPGCWEIDGDIILVNDTEFSKWDGTSLETFRSPIYRGRSLELGATGAWYQKERLEELLKLSESREWCERVFEESSQLFAAWDNWEYPDNPELITGLICCTWLQKVWPWRPIVAITGKSNSGKSILVESTLPHIFGDLSCYSDDATVAGVRQAIGHSARVLFLDEFEGGEDRSAFLAREHLMKLFMGATRGGRTLRGQPNQNGVQYAMRLLPWLASIEFSTAKGAHRNRYLFVGLKTVESNRNTLEARSPEYLQGLGQKLLAVALRHWKTALRLSRIMKQIDPEVVSGVDRRIRESFSLPCGMIAAALGLDDAAAVKFFANTLNSRDFSIQDESEDESVLLAIYCSLRRRGAREYSVRELLSCNFLPGEDEPTSQILGRLGVKRTPLQDGEVGTGIFFATDLVTRELLRGTRFQNYDLKQLLLRVPGARTNRLRLEDKGRPRGVLIPESSIHAILGSDASSAISTITGGFSGVTDGGSMIHGQF